MAKKPPVEQRRIVIYPGVGFDTAEFVLAAYVKATNKHTPGYLQSLLERTGELGNWHGENGLTFQVADDPAAYVAVYATPRQYVIKPIVVTMPLIVDAVKRK